MVKTVQHGGDGRVGLGNGSSTFIILNEAPFKTLIHLGFFFSGIKRISMVAVSTQEILFSLPH